MNFEILSKKVAFPVRSRSKIFSTGRFFHIFKNFVDLLANEFVFPIASKSPQRRYLASKASLKTDNYARFFL